MNYVLKFRIGSVIRITLKIRRSGRKATVYMRKKYSRDECRVYWNVCCELIVDDQDSLSLDEIENVQYRVRHFMVYVKEF